MLFARGRTAVARGIAAARAAPPLRKLANAVDDAPTAEAIAGLQDEFRADPSSAQVTFSSSSELTTGLRSTGNIRDRFTVQSDEPESLGGTDTAPNPVELQLVALGSCQEITYKAYGQVLGMNLERVAVDLTGHIDLRGFFAVDENARPGFHTIKGTVTIDAPGVELEALQQLKGAVDAHCPVLDMLTPKVDVTIDLVKRS